ncbi:MAG: ABC transporter ATP-binding protein [Spirochaetota bacterium]
MDAFIQIEQLTFTYPRYSDTEAVNKVFEDLNYTVNEGEFHTIIGAPESGKTTLSRILTGLVPRYSGGRVEGSVKIAGTDLREARPQDIIDAVGIVFQNPDDQLITTRVDSEIAYPLESLGLEPHLITQKVQRELERFELADKAGRNPATLSGGEKKRLLCAVLAAVAPRLWILDETLDEMDPHWRSVLLEYLQEQNSTVLLFSSKMDSKSKYSPRKHTAILSQGRLHSDPEAIERFTEQDGLRWKPRTQAGAEAEAGAGAGVQAQAQAATSEPLLKGEGLRFQYPNKGDFSLQVENFQLYPGKTLTLAGPNGCGKTTLAKLLCGLYTPQSGHLSSPYFDKTEADADFLRSSAAYMFQNPDYQIFLSTVEEELAYGLKEAGRPQEEIHDLLQTAIETFDLPPAETAPSLMSYGTRKRLQAATYWLLERPICIFDETDSGISPKDFAALIKTFQSPERSLLIISHDTELAAHFSDHILKMHAGRILPQVDS